MYGRVGLSHARVSLVYQAIRCEVTRSGDLYDVPDHEQELLTASPASSASTETAAPASTCNLLQRVSWSSPRRAATKRANFDAKVAFLTKTLVNRPGDRAGAVPAHAARHTSIRPRPASRATSRVRCAAGSATSAPPSSDHTGKVEQVVYDCSWIWTHLILVTQLTAGERFSAVPLSFSLATQPSAAKSQFVGNLLMGNFSLTSRLGNKPHVSHDCSTCSSSVASDIIAQQSLRSGHAVTTCQCSINKQNIGVWLLVLCRLCRL